MSAREKNKVDKQCVEILQGFRTTKPEKVQNEFHSLIADKLHPGYLCVDDKRNRKIIHKSNRLSKKLRIQTFHNVHSPETVMTFFHLCRITVVRCNFHP